LLIGETRSSLNSAAIP